ncbi:hypothetical protein BATDEDRAFT_22501 [Batrachochytrium dendrobatidis JAM81]|uniref:Uncharacterized protein n=1 Tax=Batrachochytrium dendrobatidis (strain JAM81 / FGSC 10211) TaxID=684364 RepID=F4NUU3_BATDJ|nr:uncharacterized protein BATDEDRAFT_22501 [Batrachochytrium dendrobatidis JAM81]EGF84443.1 hypothetical protein BATDEDRAFT_22501 [Batrachochytrium dendrobatidis JAM81]KAJ8327411.1 hypothetical protein O5D80_004800 [Batrachochytrium dendrobatidis]KAK5665200.1 hypothetical protein QVD99_008046 [Batrachochytrium dendrobatidis]|eukprot:XP_006675583.1 hypothetical protein BATDEDRAFT_22501 [Batrachochytrium dendrobatidis JAM81]
MYRELSPSRRGNNTAGAGSSFASESSTTGMVEISLGSSTDSLPLHLPATIHEDSDVLHVNSHSTINARSPTPRLLSLPIKDTLNSRIHPQPIASDSDLDDGDISSFTPSQQKQTLDTHGLPLQRINKLQIHSQQPLSNSHSGTRPVHIDPVLIPFIVQFMDSHQLYACLPLSWLWFKAAVAQLYSRLTFSQLSGKKLALALQTLQNSVIRMATASGSLSPTHLNTSFIPSVVTNRLSNGSSATAYSQKSSPLPLMEYHMFVKDIDISQIVFENPAHTPLQSWYQVRDLLGLCASTLHSLSLAIGDDSFMDLPQDYIYLHAQIAFPQLSHLTVASKCQKLPEKLILELLRASPIHGLSTIDLPRCLPNMGAASWFLLSERGGRALSRLVLTPALGPNMLGWDEHLFSTGLEQIAQACPSLRVLDLSGHSQGISDQALLLLLAHTRDLREIHLPCGLTDAHLVALLTNEPWHHLDVLGITCHCVDGEAREKRPPSKGGMSCNKFTDSVMLALLDHLSASMSAESTDLMTVYLPVYALGVKTSRRITTIEWLAGLSESTRKGIEEVVYKGKIRVLTPTNRLGMMLH